MSTKILIIEDNEQDQKILKRYLTKSGYDDCLFATSGEEGIEKINSENPAVVVTDTNLPGMNGPEACQTIKELKGDSIKVIVMTGAVDAVDAGRARKMGADDYCVKTSDCAPILEALEKIVQEINS